MENAKQRLIETYHLEPHVEGGYFRQTYASDSRLSSPSHGKTRSALTHIYFLLTAGEISRFHRVCHDEVWNFYEGAPLSLHCLSGGKLETVVLGADANSYCHVIPPNCYQAAESSGDYSLVGCTVAPGFVFEDFSFMEDPQDRKFIEDNYPQYNRFV